MAALPAASMVDVAFALHGPTLARDHRQQLTRALAVALPWLAAEPLAAVHDVNVVHGTADMALLSARARLVLRVPRTRVEALRSLAGQPLQVGGAALGIGPARVRELLPHGTLYAHFVDAGSEDEAAFMDAVVKQLERLDADCHRVCGRARQVRSEAGLLQGFSLMLHGLRAAASLRVQEHGIGGHRLMGCGVFVPHKSAAAVTD